MANFGDDDGDWALRDHIQEILLEYAMQHLTVDYAERTSEMTNELLTPYLVEVPLYDKNALLLPIEPWDKLSTMHDLSNPTPWEEKFQIAADVAQYLRNTMRLRTGTLPTDRIGEDSACKGAASVFIPDFPVLSRNARRNTPNLGAGLLSFTPRHHENMTSVAVQDEEEHETAVSVTDALELIWKMPASVHSAVSTFLKSAGALSRPSVTHRNTVLDPPERPASPRFIIPPEEFVPVFPRRKRNVGPSCMPESIAELPLPLLDSIDSEPIDFAKENMLLVDGWNTIPPISSPPPLSSPSSSQNIDEIFAFSSPNTSPSHIPKLQPMDVPPMPRRRSIKGSQTRKPIEEKYTDFLRLQLPATSVVDYSPSSPQPATSLLGQEGTVDDMDDLGVDVAAIYADVQGDDPTDVIMKATLNPAQKVLWPLPALPQPNEHPPNVLMSFKTLCQPALDGSVAFEISVFAKKVKGLKALNLTLPWTPFGSCERLPTNFEATDCSSILEGGSTTLAQSINNTLESLTLPVQTLSDDERWQQFDEFTTKNRPVQSADTLEIVLSRRGRRGHSSQPHIVDPVAGSSQLPQPDQDDLHLVQGYPVKHPRTHPTYATSTRHPPYDDDSGFFNMTPQPDAVEEPAFYGYPEDYLSGVEQTQLQIDTQEETRQFIPLGFDDSQDNFALPHTQNQPTEPLDSHLTVQTERVRHVDPLDDPFPEQLDHRVGLSDFLRLRVKASNHPDVHHIAVAQTEPQPVILQPPTTEETPTAPPDIYDSRTLRLPETMALPVEEHLYLVSLDLAQKNVLLRSLRAPDCAVDLVERDTLDGADIIMDAETSVVFASLVTLPSQREVLVERVAQQSWRYSKMLVLFEAYPESRAYKTSDGPETFNVYTPATLKALGRFRRDLNLSLACKKMDEKCVVQLAFAANVHEAALFVRYYGDLAAQEDGTMWGDRAWLDGEPAPEEDSLSAVPRMNRFAAYITLNQMDVDSFLALSPQERMHMLGRYVGEARMVSVNAYIEERTRSLEDSSDPDGYGGVDEASEYY
ncbi:hypothetical protein CYLTODRAFT_484860 [Cylindrobasidium torrendii FP15055 ss-10]|uniref:Uncharacterized protein n=1 Tax=Cylindrobasidium torrendii FP15055 ss-10 TaxID=1314674 RepID=A0A0D7BU96_9AGAR|nr:hypothetical protein CYLTODRAFT_484860 [Cylindrobasidium torrendii FP15055 ss-10]